jgi:hypothetical protein
MATDRQATATPSPADAGIAALDRWVWAMGYRRVAVVGASKNAGKTTALNALLAAASRRGERVGLVSIGLDGERQDAWLDIPKPRVRVEKGTLFVTAESSLAEADVPVRVLADAGIASSLGRAVLVEARAPGGVQLAGVPHRAHVAAAVQLLQAAGADRVVVDGAYQRQAAAHADVVEATVLAVGAVLGDTAREAAERALVTALALATPAAAGGEVLDCGGGLTGAWLARQRLPVGATIAVPGPAHVLLTAADRQLLTRRSVRIVAHRPLPLLAVATNPARPGGVDDPPDAWLTTVAQVLAAHGVRAPLVDVVLGRTLEAST